MTTFAVVGSGSAYADPAQVTRSGGATSGNLLIALVSDRSGTSQTNHVVTDSTSNSGDWTKVAGYDNLIADANGRHTLSIWARVANGADASSFTVTGDDGTGNSNKLTVFEIQPSASYSFEFEVVAINGSGIDNWNGLSSGNTTDPGGSDLFELAIASCRNNSGLNAPSATNFSTQTDDHTEHLGGSNEISHVAAIEAAGQSSGAKSATINSNGTGNEGICAVLVFSTGAAPAETLTAESGSYTLTGQAAGLLHGRTLAAQQGAYALTGQDAGLARGLQIIAETGAYTLTGQDAGLLVGRLLQALPGNYTLTGQATGLLRGLLLAAESGSYTLTGQTAGLIAGQRLTAESGSYALTGQAADLSASISITAESGAYAVTGQSAGLLRGLRLPAESGTYDLLGQSAGLNAGQRLTAASGTYALTGQSATIRVDRRLLAASGVYALTGQDADLIGGTVDRYPIIDLDRINRIDLDRINRITLSR